MEFLPLIILWIAWCAVHSVLISSRLTLLLKTELGDKYRYFRLFFTLFSVLTLIPLIMYSFSLKTQPLFTWDGLWRILQIILIAVTVLLFYYGAKHYSIRQFLGISQISRGTSHNLINESGELDTSNILGIIRHPWYTGAMILIWLRDLDISAIIVNVILTFYLIIGTYWEEQKLTVEFGEQYRDYKKNVSMFFPVKWFLSKIR